jgi:hypothetical protein
MNTHEIRTLNPGDTIMHWTPDEGWKLYIVSHRKSTFFYHDLKVVDPKGDTKKLELSYRTGEHVKLVSRK